MTLNHDNTLHNKCQIKKITQKQLEKKQKLKYNKNSKQQEIEMNNQVKTRSSHFTALLDRIHKNQDRLRKTLQGLEDQEAAIQDILANPDSPFNKPILEERTPGKTAHKP